jgi:hypothetical protein
VLKQICIFLSTFFLLHAAYSADREISPTAPLYPEVSQLRNIDNSAVILKSDELTKNARALVNSGHDEITLRQALSAAEQAISLNRFNEQALLIKDQIQTLLGIRQTVVLSANDERRYSQAIVALQRGNTIEAKAIVEQMLKTPANRSVFRVTELRAWVDFLL